MRSADNLADAKVLLASYLNIRDLLGFDKVILPVKAIGCACGAPGIGDRYMTTIYEILRRPLVTEKSSYQSGKLNQYSFIVADSATRTQVKDAIETIYDVNVAACEYHQCPCKARTSSAKPPHVRSQARLQEGYCDPGRGTNPTHI